MTTNSNHINTMKYEVKNKIVFMHKKMKSLCEPDMTDFDGLLCGLSVRHVIKEKLSAYESQEAHYSSPTS